MKKEHEKLKIGLISSSGGHWDELQWLKRLSEKYEVFYMTEADGFQKKQGTEGIYYVPKIDRKEKHFIFHFFQNIRFSLRVLKEEKPDILISTGALAAVPILYCGWLQHRKIVFIDSIARIENLSLSGKIVYPIADLFIVQWENLEKKYPKAVYASGIFGKERG